MSADAPDRQDVLTTMADVLESHARLCVGAATVLRNASTLLATMGGSERDGMPEGLLTPREAARRLGLSVKSLPMMRLRGTGPTYVKLGTRVLYHPRDLDEWIKSRRRLSATTPREQGEAK